jgi:pimeloyl-ACP methyl ester carboxylesterase
MKKIYILHGWTYSLEKWKNFAELLRKDGFESVFLKIPGLTEESDQIWNIQKYSNWLDEKLSKERDKIIILGHSNGGRIAAFFTAQHPEKIQKLILIDAAGIYHKELPLQIKRFIFGKAAQIGKKFTRLGVLKRFLYKLAGESDYREATPNMQKSMVNLLEVDLTNVFKEITADTLIIWGENDKITPLSDGELINKLIKRSRLIIIKNARHSPFYTNPEEVIQIIKNDI